MSLVDSAAHCLVITAVQTTKSRFYLCTKKKKKTENKTENKNVTHILLLWNDSSRGSLLPHAQWVRVAAVGGCPIQRMFINTDLTSNCVRFQHETADLVRPVTVSGVHACEAAVRCRAVSWRWARCQGSEAIIGAEEAADPADTWGRVSAHPQRLTRSERAREKRKFGNSHSWMTKKNPLIFTGALRLHDARIIFKWFF